MGAETLRVGLPQLSKAVAKLAGLTLRELSPLKVAVVLTQLMPGGVLSTLLTVKEQVLVRPFTSVTVRVTLMLPAPETLVPATGDCITLCTPQLSEAVAKLM